MSKKQQCQIFISILSIIPSETFLKSLSSPVFLYSLFFYRFNTLFILHHLTVLFFISMNCRSQVPFFWNVHSKWMSSQKHKWTAKKKIGWKSWKFQWSPIKSFRKCFKSRIKRVLHIYSAFLLGLWQRDAQFSAQFLSDLTKSTWIRVVNVCCSLVWEIIDPKMESNFSQWHRSSAHFCRIFDVHNSFEQFSQNWPLDHIFFSSSVEYACLNQPPRAYIHFRCSHLIQVQSW